MCCCSPRGQNSAQRNHGSETKRRTLFISTCQDFVEHSGQMCIIPQLLYIFFKPVSFFFLLSTFSYLQLPVTNMSGSGPGDRRNGADPGEEWRWAQRQQVWPRGPMGSALLYLTWEYSWFQLLWEAFHPKANKINAYGSFYISKPKFQHGEGSAVYMLKLHKQKSVQWQFFIRNRLIFYIWF